MCLPLLAPPCLQREVHSCQELVVALNDASVSRVQLMPVPGGYNCSAEDIAPQSIIVAQGREVLLEGAGPEPVYVDVRSCAGRRRGLTRVFRCHVHIKCAGAWTATAAHAAAGCAARTCHVGAVANLLDAASLRVVSAPAALQADRARAGVVPRLACSRRCIRVPLMQRMLVWPRSHPALAVA